MKVKQALFIGPESPDSFLVWKESIKSFSISRGGGQSDSVNRAGCRLRPLDQAYLFWPAGPGCGVYEAWCLWACWWCTCLPSQLWHVAASLLANPYPHQLVDLQLTNKVGGTWGLDRGKKKNRQDSLLQRDRKHRMVGVKEIFHDIYLLCSC